MPTGWKAWQMANAPPAEVVAAAQSKPIKYKPRPVQQGGLNLIQAHRVQAPLLQVHLIDRVHVGSSFVRVIKPAHSLSP
jgi:hypothetical protein